MKDITNLVEKQPDFKKTRKINSYSMEDYQNNLVSRLSQKLDHSRDIHVYVFSPANRLEQKETGRFGIVRDLIEWYGVTHTMRVEACRESNTVTIRLGKRIKNKSNA